MTTQGTTSYVTLSAPGDEVRIRALNSEPGTILVELFSNGYRLAKHKVKPEGTLIVDWKDNE